MELQDVHVAHGYRLRERLARAAVVELHLAGAVEACGHELVANLIRRRAGERRHDGLVVEGVRGEAEVHLEDLAEVHAARDAERREDDVDRIAVGVVRHVFRREHAGDDALVAVASGELVAHRDVAHLRDGHDDLLDDAARPSWSPRSREKTRTPMTRPRFPPSMRSDVSFTSLALSPKMERRRRSSGVSCVSPFGVTLAHEDVARAHFRADAE